MKSLERQLQTGLTILLLLMLFGQLVIANLSTRKILSEFVSSRLELDAKRIVDSLILRKGLKLADQTNSNREENLVKNTYPSKEKISAIVRWRRLNPVYNTPDSGHYYSIKLLKQGKEGNIEEIIHSPSLQKTPLPMEASKFPRILHDVIGPQEQHLIVRIQKYNKYGLEIIVSVAENMNLLVKQRKYFTLVFIAIGVLGFLLLIALQRYIVRRLFKHLDDSRYEIKEIESGKRQLLSEDVPSEIYPLVKEFNHSLSLMQQRLERSRNSLGNLAHALKTPLSILVQTLDNEENTEYEKKVSLIKLQAERIRQLMERELKRARMAGLGNSSQRFNPREELPVLSNVLKQAHKRDELEIKFLIGKDITAFGDREDMLELFGNLLDNACKWAEKKIICEINAQQEDRSIHIVIEDDGTGQTEDELSKLTQRGIRLDETVDGHGLGLAICKDIIKLYGGLINFKRSSRLGGFLVDIRLPGAQFR